MSFDSERVRAEFPILSREVNGHPLAYLDSAASAQRPLAVINAESHFYQHGYAAVHRGIHSLSAQATSDMEAVRAQAAAFLNAASHEEIIFVKGTTEGINLVANSWGGSQLQPGDNLIITEMEHHANIVPWQMVAQRTGAEIRVLPLIDGAQAVMHHAVDVQDIDCDFYVFSGHKIYGPTGIGVLYARKALQEQMPPWEGGGAMIDQVMLPVGTTWNSAPWRFEAGTPNTGGIIGLGAALNWVSELGLDAIHARESALMRYALDKLASVPDIVLYGPAQRSGVIAFNLGKHHAFDVGSFLDQYGIAIRTGHHCAMPLMRHYAVPAMCRASFALYNTEDEADRLAAGLTRIHRLLG